MVDNTKNLICPACRSKMTKLFIVDKFISIDICANGCGGMYFDNQELQEFSEPNEDLSEIHKLLERKVFMPVNENQTRVCPSCGTPMVKTNAFGVQIDTCYKCAGIFLDNGEFEQIRTFFKKRQKVKPVELNTSNDIDLNEFYRYKADGINYRKMGWILDVLLTRMPNSYRKFSN